jgi:hypothetical protein
METERDVKDAAEYVAAAAEDKIASTVDAARESIVGDAAQSSMDQIQQEIQSPSGQRATDGEGSRGAASANEDGGGVNAPMAKSASPTCSAPSSDPPQMARNEAGTAARSVSGSRPGDDCATTPPGDRTTS